MPLPALLARPGEFEFQDMNIHEGWLLGILPACSSISEKMEVLGVFLANATEMNRKPALNDLTRNFVGAESLHRDGVLTARRRIPLTFRGRLLQRAAGFAFPTSKDARF